MTAANHDSGDDEQREHARGGDPLERRRVGPEADQDADARARATVDAALRATLATTWPARNAAPPTSSERKRSTMPPVMSLETLTAVIDAP